MSSEQPAGEIILYQRADAPAIDVRLHGDTVWLSQQQLADLFQTSRTNVVEHIANIYAEGELSQTPEISAPSGTPKMTELAGAPGEAARRWRHRANPLHARQAWIRLTDSDE